MKIRTSFTLLLLASLLPCLAAVPLGTGDLKNEPNVDIATAEAAGQGAHTGGQHRFLPVKVAGMQVFVDAETGRLREPTEQERQELARALLAQYGNREAVSERQPLIRKNGTMSMVLDLSFLNFSIARVAPDGTLVYDCVEGPEAAEKLMVQPVANQKAGEE